VSGRNVCVGFAARTWVVRRRRGRKWRGAIARVLDICTNSRMVPLSRLKRRRRRENFADAEGEE